MNRKRYHSNNVQAICGDQGKLYTILCSNHSYNNHSKIILVGSWNIVEEQTLLKFNNRKSTFHLGKFINLVARCVHDRHIFQTSQIQQNIDQHHTSLEDGIILRDSGYALKPYLMTPYTVPTTAKEKAFIRSLKKSFVDGREGFTNDIQKSRWKQRKSAC